MKRIFFRLAIYLRKKVFNELTSVWIILGGLLSIIIAIIFFLWNDFSFNQNYQIRADKVGQFGDFVGGIVGSIWALAGVILFYVALSLQRKEFRLQRQELKGTRNIFMQQSELMKFEQKVSVFFHMIDSHRNLLKLHNFETYKYETDNTASGIKTITIKHEGTDAIDEQFKTEERSIRRIISLMHNKNGSLAYYNRDHPDNILLRLKNVDVVFLSIKTIIEFIVEHLNNDLIYHNLFYNSLTSTERLITGSYTLLGKNNAIEIINKSNFDYLIEYRASKYFISEKKIVPKFSCDFNTSKNKLALTKELLPGEFPSLYISNNMKDEKILVSELGINQHKITYDEKLVVLTRLKATELSIESLINEYFFNNSLSELIAQSDYTSIKNMLLEKNNKCKAYIKFDYDSDSYVARFEIHISTKSETTLEFRLYSY